MKNDTTQAEREHIREAFEHLIQASPTIELRNLAARLDDLKKADLRFYNALRGTALVSDLFRIIHEEAEAR